MFNSKGEVIAINTMYPQNPEIRDYNYSIPINYFIKVANYLIKNYQKPDSYVKAKLNMEGQALVDYSVNDLSTQGISVKKGIYITFSGESEVAEGRIITHVNGIEVATLLDYEFELLKYSKGDIVSITTIEISGTHPKTVNLTMK